MGSKMPRPGVQDDQAENRVKDMDDEGTDVISDPDPWLSLVGLPDPVLEIAEERATSSRRFWWAVPHALKSMIVAWTRNVD
jgi:hypothetical protein